MRYKGLNERIDTMAKKLKDCLSEKEYKLLVEKIRVCAENNRSKNKTFTTLNIPKNSLYTILKDEGITFNNEKDIQNAELGFKTLEERERSFAEKLNKVDNTKIYLNGYVNADSIVTIKCTKCNTIYSYSASNLRHRKKVFCRACEEQEKIKKQQEKERIKSNEKHFKKLEKILNSEQMAMKVCEQCGSLFLGNNKYCSNKCCKKASNKAKDINRRLKIKNNGNVDYTISLEKLIKRDNNICYLCGKDCNLEDYTYQGNTFIAGNYYPSIEHVIPLSKGGTHTWDNIKLAHRICNIMKGNRNV